MASHTTWSEYNREVNNLNEILDQLPEATSPKAQHSYLLPNHLGRVSMLVETPRTDSLRAEASVQNPKIVHWPCTGLIRLLFRGSLPASIYLPIRNWQRRKVLHHCRRLLEVTLYITPTRDIVVTSEICNTAIPSVFLPSRGSTGGYVTWKLNVWHRRTPQWQTPIHNILFLYKITTTTNKYLLIYSHSHQYSPPKVANDALNTQRSILQPPWSKWAHSICMTGGTRHEIQVTKQTTRPESVQYNV